MEILQINGEIIEFIHENKLHIIDLDELEMDVEVENEYVDWHMGKQVLCHEFDVVRVTRDNWDEVTDLEEICWYYLHSLEETKARESWTK